MTNLHHNYKQAIPPCYGNLDLWP